MALEMFTAMLSLNARREIPSAVLGYVPTNFRLLVKENHNKHQVFGGMPPKFQGKPA
jgi:excinuclease UvrABC helicase subunit UvrB